MAKIMKADNIGFCFGVSNAIAMLNKAAQRYRRVVTLGAAVHNTHVIRELESQGIAQGSLDDLEDGVSPDVVAITAHGVPPEVYSKVHSKGIGLIDTTCPIVAKAQEIVASFHHENYTPVIFGDADHMEVKSLLGWAGNGVALDVPQKLWSNKWKFGVASQTTKSSEAFNDFVHRFKELQPGFCVAKDTTCRVVSERMKEAREIAKEVDVMLVIGDRGSANTRNLAKECGGITETHHIEGTYEIDPSWRGKIGIVSGTSTPQNIIDGVIESLSKRG